MTVRREVEEFVLLGPLPDSRASEEAIALHQAHLQRIKRPVTDEEAALLVSSFGPDDCYGLAWTLLHLIESAPGGSPVKAEPSPTDNEWIRRLWSSSHR
ncbi:uncharacterized protein SOCE836_080000 [Sorangium cellulosum]|uniref:Uncharacterized protein n=1 Tax=Sorangium cellulosum TaxID=56 RepID=A0A4P2QZY1_SORCE|nr:uncharacterized protein SOCE836_080000 [Sorangium cellulosum]